MLNPFDDSYFMRQAIIEANKAFDANEVPVGAVVVAGNQVIGRGYNLTEKLHDVTAHAEIQALTAAANFLGAKYLKECSLYVTLEPCPMCAGALYWSQIGKVFYGAADEKRGSTRHQPSLYHPSTQIQGGIEEEPCVHLLRTFFEGKR
jgi:tRNA(adenine34) deaminase